MKKTVKKIMSVILALTVIATLALTAFAAEITAQDAQKIALDKAGLTAEEVYGIITEIDYEMGVKHFEVEFFHKAADGTITEYDVDINAQDGTVVKFKKEIEFSPAPVGEDIGLERAKQIALEAFGIDEKEAALVKAKRDYDDGRLVYEIEYRIGFDKEYSCDVDGVTGQIYDLDIEEKNSIFEKLELLFEIIEAWLESLFKR